MRLITNTDAEEAVKRNMSRIKQVQRFLEIGFLLKTHHIIGIPAPATMNEVEFFKYCCRSRLRYSS